MNNYQVRGNADGKVVTREYPAISMEEAREKAEEEVDAVFDVELVKEKIRSAKSLPRILSRTGFRGPIIAERRRFGGGAQDE